MDALDGTDMQEQRPDDDVRGVQGHADRNESRRPWGQARSAPEQLKCKEHRRGQIHDGRRSEEQVRELKRHEEGIVLRLSDVRQHLPRVELRETYFDMGRAGPGVLGRLFRQ